MPYSSPFPGFFIMDYSEQLQDPRWKRRRYEILVRDKHACKICGYLGPHVNVHHIEYSGMAWDAPDDALITLCRNCHRKLHIDKIPVGHSIREILKLWQKDS